MKIFAGEQTIKMGASTVVKGVTADNANNINTEDK